MTAPTVARQDGAAYGMRGGGRGDGPAAAAAHDAGGGLPRHGRRGPGR
jgi:hypothetical protein